MPDDVWFQFRRDDPSETSGSGRQISPARIATCRDEAYKRYLIGPSRAKSIGTAGGDPSAEGRHRLGLAGGGRSTRRSDDRGTPVARSFSYGLPVETTSGEARLTATFPLGFAVAQMKKLILSLRPTTRGTRSDLRPRSRRSSRWRSAESYSAANGPVAGDRLAVPQRGTIPR